MKDVAVFRYSQVAGNPQHDVFSASSSDNACQYSATLWKLLPNSLRCDSKWQLLPPAKRIYNLAHRVQTVLPSAWHQKQWILRSEETLVPPFKNLKIISNV